MARRRRYAPIQRLRWLLLALLVVFVAWVTTVFLQARREPPEESPTEELLEGSDRDDLVLAGEGFEYEHTEGGERVFRLVAERILSDRAGRIELERVTLYLEREDGEPWVSVSERAIYRLESSEALLEGDVTLSGGDGLELRTEGIRLVREGTALESTGPVQFELGPGYSGRADSLVYHLNRNRLRLSGRVRIEGTSEEGTPGALRCRELEVERDERLVRAEGGVELRQGESLLRAKRLALTYGEDEKTVEFVRASWEVSGTLREASGNDVGTSVAFAGHQLSLLFADGEYEKAELESLRGGGVWLEARDDAGLARRLDAPYLVADFAAGEISLVRAFDGVRIREGLTFADGFALRSACAEWALASFDPSGELAELVLQNRVDYQEQGVQAEGQRVRSAGKEVVFTGDPATLRSDRGVVQAPRIVWAGESGRVSAGDGVRAEFPRGGRFSLIGGGAEQPVLLTSQRARWTEDPPEYGFEGEVRAWQGEDYLLADRLDGDRAGDRLRASGNVKTVIRSRRDREPAAEGAAPAAPVEVTADELTYERPERMLTYAGNVKAHETGRTLRCLEMEARLTAEESVERLTCRGDTVLENPEGGHTLRGNEAVYEPGSGRVEISGTPVVMTNRDGAELRGPVVIYDVETGAAQVRTQPRGEPAEGATSR